MENVYRCASAGSVDIIKPPDGNNISHTLAIGVTYRAALTGRPLKERRKSSIKEEQGARIKSLCCDND